MNSCFMSNFFVGFIPLWLFSKTDFVEQFTLNFYVQFL